MANAGIFTLYGLCQVLNNISWRAVRFYGELFKSEYEENDLISARFYEGLPNVA